MFFYTDTADAPWTIIKSNDKKRARLNCMLHFLQLARLSRQGRPKSRMRPDPLIVGRAEHVVHRADHILGTSLHPLLRHGDDPGKPNGPAQSQPAAEPAAKA